MVINKLKEKQNKNQPLFRRSFKIKSEWHEETKHSCQNIFSNIYSKCTIAWKYINNNKKSTIFHPFLIRYVIITPQELGPRSTSRGRTSWRSLSSPPLFSAHHVLNSAASCWRPWEPESPRDLETHGYKKSDDTPKLTQRKPAPRSRSQESMFW